MKHIVPCHHIPILWSGICFAHSRQPRRDIRYKSNASAINGPIMAQKALSKVIFKGCVFYWSRVSCGW